MPLLHRVHALPKDRYTAKCSSHIFTLMPPMIEVLHHPGYLQPLHTLPHMSLHRSSS